MNSNNTKAIVIVVAHTAWEQTTLGASAPGPYIVVVVIAGADEAATLQFLAPYTGATIAEYFMLQGEATCTVYDDLTKHAISYREAVDP